MCLIFFCILVVSNIKCVFYLFGCSIIVFIFLLYLVRSMILMVFMWNIFFLFWKVGCIYVVILLNLKRLCYDFWGIFLRFYIFLSLCFYRYVKVVYLWIMDGVIGSVKESKLYNWCWLFLFKYVFLILLWFIKNEVFVIWVFFGI